MRFCEKPLYFSLPTFIQLTPLLTDTHFLWKCKQSLAGVAKWIEH